MCADLPDLRAALKTWTQPRKPFGRLDMSERFPYYSVPITSHSGDLSSIAPTAVFASLDDLHSHLCGTVDKATDDMARAW
jgi:hypothetical protein